MTAETTTMDRLTTYVNSCMQSSDPVQLAAGRMLQKIMSTYDMEIYCEIESKYWAGQRHIKMKVDDERKFLDLPFWIYNKINLAAMLGLPGASPKRILDIGAGAGHFMAVASALGHRCHGIDLPHDLFDDICNFFQLSRTHHMIKAFQPLPTFDGQFDIVTSFYVSFDVDAYINFGEDACQVAWGREEWDYFLSDIANNVLSDKGCIYLLLNSGSRVQTGLNYRDGSLKRYFEELGAVFIEERIGLLKLDVFDRFKK